MKPTVHYFINTNEGWKEYICPKYIPALFYYVVYYNLSAVQFLDGSWVVYNDSRKRNITLKNTCFELHHYNTHSTRGRYLFDTKPEEA